MAESQVKKIYKNFKRVSGINREKKSNADVAFAGIVAMVIVYFIGIITPLPYEGDIVILSMKCIIAILAATFLHNYLVNMLKNWTKNAILPAVMQSFDDVFILFYDYKKGYEQSYFTASKMYQCSINKFVSNKIIQAIVGNNTGLQFAHIDVESNTDNTQNVNVETYNITIFSGMFSEIEFDKTFNFKIRLHTKDLYVDYGYFMESNRYDIITSENKEFDDIYTVVTTDKQQASYILTPDFMDTLIKFHKIFPTNIDLGFSHGMLYIAVHQLPDLLDITPSNVSQENLEKLYQFVKFNISIINILNNNPNIERIDEVVEG